jgi:bifunctional non-homologous end joining protein LigD
MSPMAKLAEYRRKRQFDRTPEPPPLEAPSSQDGTFVVQKHAARRLHYDFRLAIDGVLKSWAVPKGPSLNTHDKRLAVQTEDHPMDYANFEGKIPEGSYGAGTVMVWDRGTFSAEGNQTASHQVAHGEIKFSLQGEKLRGSFVLVKLKHSEKGNEWLMIKHADSAADPAWNIDEHDGSVLTGRTLPEIAEEIAPKREAAPLQAAEIEGARKSAMPAAVDPMLATLTEKPFSNPAWLFEIKWDGVRTIARIADGKVTLRSRKANDVTSQYPEMAALPECLHAQRAILDGEIVVLDDRGHSSFERLQERMHVRKPPAHLLEEFPVTYYVFDLLYCDGYDLREAPLLARKELLRRLLHPRPAIRYADHQLEKGKELFELVRQQGLEGIVGKRTDSRYAGVRSPNWVKIKSTHTLDAVVGGWTAPRAGRAHFGSLLLGLYEGKALQFIGHVGTGFDEKTLESIGKMLAERKTTKCPFATVPETNEEAFWVKPELVARVRFTGITDERRLRAPAFLGLREDIAPEDCLWPSEVKSAAPSSSEGGPAQEDEHTSPEATQPESGPIPKGKARRSNGTNSHSPNVVRSPELVGDVIRDEKIIEAELLKGKKESILLELEGKRFRLTHLNKMYFPESGYTKRDLLAYYWKAAPLILPFLKDRPLVLRRYPDGIKGQAFFQKDVRTGIPDWLETIPIHSTEKGEDVHYVIANNRASLLYLTGLGCIDHNPWSSRRDDLAHPDYFFFDLDPADGTEFSAVIALARALYDELISLGIKAFPKTSGATGFHIYIPVERRYTYEQLRTFAEIIARIVSSKKPELVTHERIVAKRLAGRVLIDVTQNAEGRPLAAPYAVRAFPKAPVSTPLRPEEMRAALRADSLNIKTLFPRLKEKGDLWADFWSSRQGIEDAFAKLAARVPQSNAPAHPQAPAQSPASPKQKTSKRK